MKSTTQSCNKHTNSKGSYSPRPRTERAHYSDLDSLHILKNLCSAFRRLAVMSHHLVTVCVVCVLCAAHVPCSAHTDLSATVVNTVLANSTNPKNDPSSLNAQGQLLWTLERHKEEAAYSNEGDKLYPSSFSNNNKRDTVRYNDTARRVINDNNNVRINVKATANDDTYVKKKIAENFKGGGRIQQQQQDSANQMSADDSRDIELLKRLAQTELLLTSKLAKFSEESRTVNSFRLKRDATVDEKYFMRKIFEAYGDGTSLTMDGFEKLVRKLGLLRLLNDASKSEDGSVDRNMHKNQLGNVVSLLFQQ